MLEQIEISNENQQTTQRSKAIEYLKQLQSKTASINLSRFLYKFSQKREIDSNTFINGIKQFISIANLNLQQRQYFYGDACAGLHYSVTLVDFFNKHNSKTLHRYDLDFIASSDWQYITPSNINSSIALVYYGRDPAQALNKLLQGPTTIDCGMFCQLSIWFGIRYMLGDEQFNTVFGRTPLCITQYNYNAVGFFDNPYAGSPLFFFMSAPGEENTSNVSIEYIANTSFYPIKHPTGLSCGDNCIVIDDRYFIFSPNSEVNTGLTKW